MIPLEARGRTRLTQGRDKNVPSKAEIECRMLNAEMQNAECRSQISDGRFIRAIPICILKSAVVVSSDAWVPAAAAQDFQKTNADIR
jgi:hypothetical protein